MMVLLFPKWKAVYCMYDKYFNMQGKYLEDLMYGLLRITQLVMRKAVQIDF